MTTSPGGADLARMALASAKAAAAARGADGRATRAPKRKRSTAARQSGRDPVNLGSALGALLVERGWQTPTAGGSVLDAWPAIAGPDLAAHVTAESFDAETGRLDLAADSAAWAFQTRLNMRQLIAQANRIAGGEVVRDIRVLPPGRARSGGPRFSTATEDPHPVTSATATDAAPHEPPATYQLARQQLRDARTSHPPDPRIAAARQESSPTLHEPVHIMAAITARLHGLTDDHVPQNIKETTVTSDHRPKQTPNGRVSPPAGRPATGPAEAVAGR